MIVRRMIVACILVSSCKIGAITKPQLGPQEEYLGATSKDDAPYPVKAVITNAMFRALQTVGQFRREEGSSRLTKEEKEIDGDGFSFYISYAKSSADENVPSFLSVVMLPKLVDLRESPHRQGNRRESRYLVEISSNKVMCWKFDMDISWTVGRDSVYPCESIRSAKGKPYRFPSRDSD